MLLLPAVILTIIFSYIPIGGIVMAFQDFKPWLGISGSKWVGLANFEKIFFRQDSQRVIGNTLFIAVLKIVTNLIVPYIFALLLNEIRQSLIKRTIQTLVYLPHFLSWVILGGILIDILSPSGGLINQMLGALFGIDPIFFLGEGNWFRFTVIVSDNWKDFGFSAIIFLAALAGIDPSLYEAAEVDGANRWQQTLHVTIPAFYPITVVLATLSLGQILNAGFDQIFNLYNPLVYDKGDIIDTFVYRVGIISGQMGFGTAVGLFKSAIGFTLIVIAYRLAYKLANYRIF